MGSQDKDLEARLVLDPQNQNSYSYARNNPLRLVDISGNLSSTTKAFLGGFARGAAISAAITLMVMAAPITVPMGAAVAIGAIGVGLTTYEAVSANTAYQNGTISAEQHAAAMGNIAGAVSLEVSPLDRLCLEVQALSQEPPTTVGLLMRGVSR
jgi:ethanolamine utilization microcompartment shell protein EutL